MSTNNYIPYTDRELSLLVEEFIIRQHAEFTLKDLYAYITYWGMEEGRIQSNQLESTDREKINIILNKIVKDGRILVDSIDGSKYSKQ